MDYNHFVYDFIKESWNKKTLSVCHKKTDKLGIKIYDSCHGLPFIEQYIDNVYVNGGGLCVNGEIVPNTALTSGWQSGYDFNEKDAEHVEGPVIFIGMLCNYCWGHTITDSLAHLWWFHTKEYKENYSNLPIYYWAPKPIQGNYLELMRLAGLPLDKVHYLDTIMHFDKALVPDSCFDMAENNMRIFSEEYVSLLDHIVNQCSIVPKFHPKKIYMIRPNESRQYFCKEVKSILESKGYVYFDPLRYTLQEQIAIYNHAEDIVVEESSMAHNTIFCKKGTKVCILRKCNTINEYQVTINELRNLDVTYIDCHLSVLTRTILPTEGPFFCYANDLFCKCFGVEYFGFPYKEFRRWLNYHNWFMEDVTIRADRLQWDENYSLIFAKELEFTRLQAEKRFDWIRHMPIISKSIKNRGFMWLVKKNMRHLI